MPLRKNILAAILFLFNPETIHHFSVGFLRFTFKIPGVRSLVRSLFTVQNPSLEKEVFGIKFPNPVGLAAGFDKEAIMIDQLEAFGFGFIEIGTLTPKGQPGNPKPRIFRLPTDGALINRMGFNNEGVDVAVKKLRSRRSEVLIGGNIGKNKITPNEEAVRDYEYCFEALFDVVDYFVVNISSPNTPNLRALQDKEPLTQLLTRLQHRNNEKITPKPMLLKIAPDLTDGQLDDIIDIVKATELAGIIATNTTIGREGLKTSAQEVEQIGAGGLSGAPLKARANDVIRYLRKSFGPDFPIIGVGGIMTPEDAVERLNSGATLIQIYTGFIYNGPGFVKQINKALLKAN